MAGAKQGGNATKSKKTASDKPGRKAAPKLRPARDVLVVPTAEQIEQSLARGKSGSLADFRKTIGWV